jgi:iron complex outermembrane receptor protein
MFSGATLWRSLSGWSLALASVLAAGAFDPAVADEADVDSLQQVIVTATKRETPLYETPISLTVIGTDALHVGHVDDFAGYARLVPGLTAIDSGPGEKRYALRGLQAPGEPEVALYYDEIPISGLPGPSLDTGNTQLDLKLFDVDRIEVLRGPEGTLYGNGSMGGALRILSRRPDPTGFAATSEGEYGITEGGAPSWGASAMVNAPVIHDRVAVRLTFYDRHEGGWIDNLYRSNVTLPQPTGANQNWQHTWGSRFSANWIASDRWTTTAIFYFQKLATGNSSETYPAFAVPDDRYVSAALVRTPWDERAVLGNLISTYDLGWASLVATGSYQNRTADQSLDTTRYVLSLSGCNERTWEISCTGPPRVPAVSFAHTGVIASSAEMRLVSRKSTRLQWTVGAFLQRATTYRFGQTAVANAQEYLDFDPVTGITYNRFFARTNHDHFDQYAVFGEATAEIYRGWNATVGLRWFHSYRTDDQVINQQFFAGQPVGEEPFQSFSESALFKKFQLSRQMTPRWLLYAQAAQGFRAGGPNYPGGFTATAPPYRSDSVWDYELGSKVSSADTRFAFSAAVFRINWSDLQQLVPSSLFNSIVNAGSARSDGFEAELEAHPSSAWELSLGTSLANAHLIGPQPHASAPSAQLFEGQRLGGAPKWTGNASASYTLVLPAGLHLKGRVDYSYQSSRSSVTTTLSPAYFTVGASNLTSLHLLLEQHERWTLGLHITNLFNDFEPLSAKALDSNLVHTVTAAAPRTSMLTATWQF